MVVNSVEKLVFCLNIVIDAVLLGTIFTINSLDDLATAIKICTSILVAIFTLVRIYFFIREKH